MKLDVVVPIFRDASLVDACLRSVVAHSGARLGRLFLVDDRSPEPQMLPLLERWRRDEPRVRLLQHEANLGFVRAANLGLAASDADVVVLNSDTRVTSGWLEALAAVLEGEPRVAAASPLSNNAGMCSVPTPGEDNHLAESQVAALRLGGLPAFTPMQTAPGFCLLLRRAALRELGAFDPAYGRGYHEENDWCQRARAAGWAVGRANRAFVFHVGKASFGAERAALDQRNGWRLAARYPHFFEDARRFDEGPLAGLAARAVRASLGLLRVDDFALVTLDQPRGPRALPWVAQVREGDLAPARGAALAALLQGVQGAVTAPALEAQLSTRWPGLRLGVGAEPGVAFLTDLALRPDMAALAHQGA
jgi:GT2 family glycosyltransferase